MEIKFDKRNYRKHSEQNKKRIKKSLKECGAGRSVLVDADDTLIAGNGVYEQAQAMGIPTRVIETDGTELVVVKRTDLRTDDDKRKLLAMADNATSRRKNSTAMCRLAAPSATPTSSQCAKRSTGYGFR